MMIDKVNHDPHLAGRLDPKDDDTMPPVLTAATIVTTQGVITYVTAPVVVISAQRACVG